jgi:hypothetical protein
MKSFAILAVAALVAQAFAAPTAIPITKLAGPTQTDTYIVKLKDGVSKNSHISRLLEYIGSKDSKIVYKVSNLASIISENLTQNHLSMRMSSTDMQVCSRELSSTTSAAPPMLNISKRKL